jgi:hypothetical protein
MRRRAFLLSTAMLGACRGTVPARASSRGTAAVDDSFARAVASRAHRQVLLSHPAFDAIMRHRRLSGDERATRDEVLDRLLAHASVGPRSERVLDHWSQRHGELRATAEQARALLPANWRFDGTIHLVVGYDIGVAAPPDVLLNVGHEHFARDPEELSHYCVHEIHHVGFLSKRPRPPLDRLDDPAALRALIAYMTQLEGMAVHAAYEGRRANGRLASDDDYRVYVDHVARRDAVERYRQCLEGIETARSRELVGDLLSAMSSGERLWYRVGAIACAEIEAREGRARLIGTIDDPSAFARAVERVTGR